MSEIQKKISQLWDEQLTNASFKVIREPNFQSLLSQFEENSVKEAIKYLEPWLSILSEGISWLAQLHVTIDMVLTRDPEKDRRILAPCSLIGTACVHAVAIRRLALSGLDASARVILRTLIETLNASIALINDPNLSDGFCGAQDFNESKDFWAKNLSPKKLEKIISKIESKFVFDANVIRQLKEWRQKGIALSSQYVHSSFVASCLSASPCSLTKPIRHVPGILGVASSFSIQTLSMASRSIWHFSRFGLALLMEIAKNGDENSPESLIFQGKMGVTMLIGRNVYNKLILRYWEYDN